MSVFFYQDKIRIFHLQLQRPVIIRYNKILNSFMPLAAILSAMNRFCLRAKKTIKLLATLALAEITKVARDIAEDMVYCRKPV